jgi:hypothetical protein
MHRGAGLVLGPGLVQGVGQGRVAPWGRRAQAAAQGVQPGLGPEAPRGAQTLVWVWVWVWDPDPPRGEH